MADLQDAFRYGAESCHVLAPELQDRPGLEATARALRGLADGLAAQEAELRVREIEGRIKRSERHR